MAEVRRVETAGSKASTDRPRTNKTDKSVPVEALVASRLSDMCNYLGIAETEKYLFWIAEMALVAKLPPYWKEYKDKEGHAYYHNHGTGATSWSHPRDTYFQELVTRERKKIKEIAKFVAQQRSLRWDPEGTPDNGSVELSNKGTTVTNISDSSYPTLRAANKMSLGVHVIAFHIDSLQQDGYVFIGIGNENVAYNTDAIPPDDYNCHGYTTVGEIYSAGRLIETSKEELREGDTIVVSVDFSQRSIVWYRNNHPVGFIEGFEGTGMYPCIVLGYRDYKISIVPESFPPHLLMKWDPAGKHAQVELEKNNMVAKSNSPTGYATVRTGGFFDRGKPYFELLVDVMARDGFMLIGIGNADVHMSETQIPSEEFNHYGYASTGEAFAQGQRVRKGLPRVQRGDIVGFQIIFDEQRIVFYINDKPVLELPDVASYEQYYPTVTFGNAGYAVSMRPTPYIPLGVPKWQEDSQHPRRFTVHEENIVVRCVKPNTLSTVMSDVEYVASTQYFEVVIEALHPEAELCVGLSFATVGKNNNRLIPEVAHNHYGYCHNGDLVARGVVFQKGAPKIRLPDRIGIMIDFAMEKVTFFSNGHPVGRHSSNYLRGKFRPVVTCVGSFEAHIVPTPAPPSLIPEWDPLRMQEAIELSRDALTACVRNDTQSARTVWSATSYNQGVLYFELVVELHGRSGYMVYGVGNRNFAGEKGQKRANLPFEEYFVVGYTSRGEIIAQGAVERTGEEPWSNSDVIGMRIDFAAETFCAYKNGHPVIVGNCTGTAVGVSPMATFVYGPHALRINPMPHVPPPPHRWDPELCDKHVKLSNYDLHSKNLVQTGYPTIVTTSVVRFGKSYIELDIDYVPESGFLMLGVAGEGGGVHECKERVPPGQYHHWGYASTGEIWARGMKEIGGREDVMTGDTFGMMVDMDVGTLMFYKNGYPVGYYVGVEGAGVTRGVRFCVTFGYTNYSVSIKPTAKLPDGSPRWDMVCKSKDIRITRDHLTCTNTTYLNAPTIRATSGFTEGRVFFEVRINYIKLGGYIAVGLGAHDIHENNAVYPPAHYQYIAYTTMGELLMNGEIVAVGLPRAVMGDDIGLQADYESGLIVFYKNRHPVGELTGLRGELYPAVVMTNENYSVSIHTNAKERLEVPPFMNTSLNPKLVLSNYDFSVTNTTNQGFPTIRVTGKYRVGTFFFEATVDKLGEGGYMCFGLGSLNIHENNEYLPSEKYSSYAYSSVGELYALGEVVSAGHAHFQEGSTVGFMCSLDKSFVTFYINNLQVGELRNLAPHMEYSSFVVLGNGNFKVSISRVPSIAKLFAVNEIQAEDTKNSRDEAKAYLPVMR